METPDGLLRFLAKAGKNIPKKEGYSKNQYKGLQITSGRAGMEGHQGGGIQPPA